MGSEAKTTSDHLPETPSPTVSELISELKTCFSSINFQNATKILMNREQDLLNKTHFLENEKDEILKENKKLNDLLKKKDAKIESLEKEKDAKIESLKKENDVKIESLKKEKDVKIESLKREKDVKIKSLKKENDVKIESLKKEKDVKIESLKKEKDAKIESLEKENEGLKDEVKKKQNEIGVYEKKFLDLDGKVSSLEKLSKELLGSGDHSVDLEVKNPKNVVGEYAAETNVQLMSNEKRESKQGTDDKFPDTNHTIQIDNDDEDGEDDENDIKYVPSSKRQPGSSEIKREYDSDDDRCISILRRKPVTNEIPSERNNDHVDKIPTGTTTRTMPEIQTGIQQITSHSASPFWNSGSDDGKVKEANETIPDKQKESESCRKQMSSEKGESQERTNHKFPDIIQIDDDEDGDENDLKDVSSLKRKRSSSNVKVEDDSDDERGLSVLRRKSVSKELQSECNNDLVNIIPTGRQPITSHSATQFLDSGKSDDEIVEEAYERIIEKHTERWETEAEMIIEFSKSSELCMNAVCTLHRQNIYVGAYLLPRFNQLAEWLIDGDPEKKLKKTPSELNRFQLDQCRMFAVNYSVELFKVYQQNADRFFPPRS